MEDKLLRSFYFSFCISCVLTLLFYTSELASFLSDLPNNLSLFSFHVLFSLFTTKILIFYALFSLFIYFFVKYLFDGKMSDSVKCIIVGFAFMLFNFFYFPYHSEIKNTILPESSVSDNSNLDYSNSSELVQSLLELKSSISDLRDYFNEVEGFFRAVEVVGYLIMFFIILAFSYGFDLSFDGFLFQKIRRNRALKREEIKKIEQEKTQKALAIREKEMWQQKQREEEEARNERYRKEEEARKQKQKEEEEASKQRQKEEEETRKRKEMEDHVMEMKKLEDREVAIGRGKAKAMQEMLLVQMEFMKYMRELGLQEDMDAIKKDQLLNQLSEQEYEKMLDFVERIKVMKQRGQ